MPAGTGLLNLLHTTNRAGVPSYTGPSLVYSYQAPIITWGGFADNGPSSGGSTTMTGANFGPSFSASNRYITSIFGIATATFWNDSMIVFAIPVATTSKTLSLTVFVDGITSNTTYTYDAPRFTKGIMVGAPVQQVLPTTGVTVTLQGTSFGSSVASFNVTLFSGGNRSNQTCAWSIWGHTQIVCTVPPGVGHSWSLVIYNSFGSNTPSGVFNSFNYSAPSVTGWSPSPVPTSGAILSIGGNNFGASGSPISITIGGRSCDLMNSTHTEIFCIAQAGQGGNNPLVITVPTTGFLQSFTTNFAYQAPVLSTISPSELPVLGNINVTIGGNSFGNGTQASVVVGTQVCPIILINQTVIVFTAPAGIGNRILSVTVSGQTTSFTSLSTQAPTITRISISSSVCINGINGTSLDSCTWNGGNRLITLAGDNFALNASDLTVIIGSVTCENVTLLNSTAIQCNLPTTNVGGERLNVQVVRPDRASNVLIGAVSYQSMRITPGSLRCSADNPPQAICQTFIVNTSTTRMFISYANQLPMSGIRIGMFLRGFPQSATADNLFVRYGTSVNSFDTKEFNCIVVGFDNITGSLECVIGGEYATIGIGGNFTFMVRINATSDFQTTVNSVDFIDFTAPEIIPATIRFNPAEVTGETDILLPYAAGGYISFDVNYVGTDVNYLGVFYRLRSMTGDWTPCRSIDLILGAGATLICLTQSGSGGPYIYQVRSRLGTLVSTPSSDVFNFPAAPVISSVQGCVNRLNLTTGCSTEGNEVISIYGANFPSQLAYTIFIGSQYCTNIVQITSGFLQCRTPASNGGINVDVQLIVGDSVTGRQPLLSYSPPVVSAVRGCQATEDPLWTKNCLRGMTLQNIVVEGMNFGRNNAQILVGGVPCLNVTHDPITPHRKLRCRLPLTVNYFNLTADIVVFQQSGAYSSERARLSFTPCSAGSFLETNLTSYLCRLCAPGKYVPASLQNPGECLACAPGFYSLAGAVRCSPCPSGRFSAISGAATCQPCGAGSYSQQSTCALCPAGTFWTNTTTPSCTDCPSGFYTNSSGQTQCVGCPAGQETYGLNGRGGTACQFCLPGKFSYGNSSCQFCPPGREATTSGMQDCVDCELGTYNARFGASDCITCPTGRYANSTRASVCRVCPVGHIVTNPLQGCQTCSVGFYQPNLERTVCFQCEPGKFAGGEGQSACSACAAGRFASEYGSTLCGPCGLGTFSSQSAAVSCMTCPAGKVTNANSTMCQDCPAGRVPVGGACVACPSGTVAAVAGLRSCVPCIAGFVTLDAINCVPCGTLGTTCTSCLSGAIAAGPSSATCITCRPGQWLDQARFICRDCPPGQFSTTTTALNCTSCGDGRESFGSASSCSTCQPGYFSSRLTNNTCQPCAPGSSQSLEGRSACQVCQAGTYQSDYGLIRCNMCPPGLSSPSNASACGPCPVGTAADSQSPQVCNACPEGRYTNRTGMPTCLECLPGFYTNQPASSQCEPCINSYQDQSGQIGCKICPDGNVPDIPTGASTCFECPIGRYVNSALKLCQDCEMGRFGNLPGKSSCNFCTIGKFSASVGSTVCTECYVGYISKTNATTCDACESGKFSEDGVTCGDCEAGRYSGAGASGCTWCPSGYYSNQSATGCSLCPAGFYQPADQQGKCVVCDSGKVSQAGQVSCTSCPVGQYAAIDRCLDCSVGQYSNGLGTCISCEPGKFQSATSQASCNECPGGTFQNNTGATECIPCSAGTFPNRDKTECSLCGPGLYADTPGLRACISCPPGYFTRQNGSITCTPCPLGQYQSASKATTCINCASGEFTSVNGSTTCQPCPTGTRGIRSSNISSCIACSPGFFNNNPGLSSECPYCAAGQYASEEGSEQCRLCPLGRFTGDFQTIECPLCSPGKYADKFQSRWCLDCAPGLYSSQNGTVNCFSCEPGTFARDPASLSCTLCGNGTFQPNFGGSFCQVCAAGFFNDRLGQRACQPCPKGRYQNRNNSAICIPCPTGTYQALTGQSDCATCENGTQNANTEQESCSPCQPGFFQDGRSPTQCFPCPGGSYQPLAQRESCLLCAAGTANNNTGQVTCAACPPGSYASEPGRPLCSLCPKGFAQRNPASLNCSICPPGSFANDLGFISCSPCPSGTVSPFTGSSTCTACDSRQQAVPNAELTGCSCGLGYYSDSNNQAICKKCPQGVVCDKLGLSYDKLETQPGWWRLGEEFVFYQCQQTTYCMGGLNNTCAENRGGPLCAFCLAGFHAQSGSQGGCIKCPPQGSASGYMVIIILVVLAVLCGLYYIILRSDRKLQTEVMKLYSSTPSPKISNEILPKTRERKLTLREINLAEHTDNETVMEAIENITEAEDVVMENMDMEVNPDKLQSRNQRILHEGNVKTKPNATYKLKICLGFLQVIGNFSFQLEVPWPTYFWQFIQAMKIFNLDFLQWASVDCVVKTDYFMKYILFILVLPAIFIALFLGYFLPSLYLDSRDLSDDNQQRMKRQFLRQRFLKLCIFTVFLIYPSLSATILRLYVCRKVANVYFLVEDFNIQCYTDRWNTYASANVVSILVYPVGIPVIFSLLLWRNRDRLSLPNTRLKYGFLYDAYSESCWWFELADIANKLFMTSVLGFFPFSAQIPIGMCWNMIFTIVLLRVQPYLRKGDDRLHLLGQIEIFLLMLMGYVLTTPKAAYDMATDILLSMVCITMTLLLPVYFVMQATIVLRKLIYRRARSRILGKNVDVDLDLSRKRQLSRLMAGSPRDNFSRKGSQESPSPNAEMIELHAPDDLDLPRNPEPPRPQGVPLPEQIQAILAEIDQAHL